MLNFLEAISQLYLNKAGESSLFDLKIQSDSKYTGEVVVL